jgi:polyisoprenoid-binding protein YceI
MTTDILTVDKSHSEVTFQVRHLLTKVRGQFDDYEGAIRFDAERPEESSVELRIRAASVNTFVADRDQHLRSADFFDVEAYPELLFKSTAIVAKGDGRFLVTGDLTLRGVTREVTLPVTFLGMAADPWGNTRAGFELETAINRKDFGMQWNVALDQGGVLLGDEVKVAINLETIKAQAEAAA